MVIDLFTERIFQVFIGFLCLFMMVHGFTCSGLTETQNVNSCKVSRIGHVEQQYVSTGNVTVPDCSLQEEFLLFNWAFAFAFCYCGPTVSVEWKVHIYSFHEILNYVLYFCTC